MLDAEREAPRALKVSMSVVGSWIPYFRAGRRPDADDSRGPLEGEVNRPQEAFDLGSDVVPHTSTETCLWKAVKLVLVRSVTEKATLRHVRDGQDRDYTRPTRGVFSARGS
jgi:hypothetical protein